MNEYEEFKPFDTNRKDKQQVKLKLKVWSNDKWTTIKRVIRHKTNKKIFKVNTHCGVVDVTEDHSLLNSNKEIIKAEECKVGETELLQSYPINIDESIHLNEIINILDLGNKYSRTIEDKKAFIYDFFMVMEVVVNIILNGN